MLLSSLKSLKTGEKFTKKTSLDGKEERFIHLKDLSTNTEKD